MVTELHLSIIRLKTLSGLSTQPDLNRRPSDLQSDALPLSYECLKRQKKTDSKDSNLINPNYRINTQVYLEKFKDILRS